MNRETAYLGDIVISARLVQGYLQGVTQDAFMGNVQLQDSVIRRLEIMGEAAGRLSAEFRERHPAIPWARIIGMRNRMIHGYDDIDLDTVWVTVQERIPELLALIEPLAPPASDESQERE